MKEYIAFDNHKHYYLVEREGVGSARARRKAIGAEARHLAEAAFSFGPSPTDQSHTLSTASATAFPPPRHNAAMPRRALRWAIA